MGSNPNGLLIRPTFIGSLRSNRGRAAKVDWRTSKSPIAMIKVVYLFLVRWHNKDTLETIGREESDGDEARACPEVLVEPLPKVCGVQIKRG